MILLQDWIRRLRALLQQGADVDGSLAQEQLSWLMEQYAQVDHLIHRLVHKHRCHEHNMSYAACSTLSHISFCKPFVIVTKSMFSSQHLKKFR